MRLRPRTHTTWTSKPCTDQPEHLRALHNPTMAPRIAPANSQRMELPSRLQAGPRIAGGRQTGAAAGLDGRGMARRGRHGRAEQRLCGAVTRPSRACGGLGAVSDALPGCLLPRLVTPSMATCIYLLVLLPVQFSWGSAEKVPTAQSVQISCRDQPARQPQGCARDFDMSALRGSLALVSLKPLLPFLLLSAMASRPISRGWPATCSPIPSARLHSSKRRA
ncbi:hypothetical protein BS50DRAFT_23358 [Corynespora cassiicola Philippines]|uniref:Uncharacterized protein n=1 Tax=Corynespora cassiicola Philippines TaxID=1448308 RepID=A0A2T2PAR1_CORCC|nr:hypothetical protein BS50DRAFT_23358 [Corynespora cassiicola Philippines]